jgi:hypothetical protein
MTELTDRMRTCAAFLCGQEKAGDGSLRDFGKAILDAVDLLLEASNVLEAIPEPLGVPMEIFTPKPPAAPAAPIPDRTLGGDNDELYRQTHKGRPIEDIYQDPGVPPNIVRGPRPNRVCPQCDSRAHKRVYREGNTMFLACPVCGAAWKYKP